MSSVRDGMIALGQRALQRWVRLLIMSSIVRDDHPELLKLASVRARYCETLEGRLGTGRGLEAFAAGMVSILGPEGVLSTETLAALPVGGHSPGHPQPREPVTDHRGGVCQTGPHAILPPAPL